MSSESTPSPIKLIYNFFKSLKLALVLILYITATSIISTFIQQGRDLGFYLEAYPPLVAWLIVFSGFNNFFSSLLFAGPTFVFFLNLATCTFHRFRTRLINKAKKRFGPDILHVGLLIMIIGGVVSISGREERSVMLNEGDSVHIPGGYVLTVEKFEFLKYENGSPKDWISTVKVVKDEKSIQEAYPIEVNKPLKIGNVKLYQSTYKVNSFIVLSDRAGGMYKLSPGQMIPVGDDGYILRDVVRNDDNISELLAHFDFLSDREITGHKILSASESVDKYKIEKMDYLVATGLQMVIDPGYYPILIGLLLLTLGLFITFIQKIFEEKI